MEMRKYRDEDLPELVEIANAAWAPIRKMGREALGDRIADQLYPMGDAASKGVQIREQFASGLYEALVCEHEGKIVGFITFKVEGVFGEICNNAARPASGLKGIGQLMYHTVLDLFRSRGVKVAKVTTGLDWAHAPARRAYERAGFRNHLDSTTYFMELEPEGPEKR